LQPPSLRTGEISFLDVGEAPVNNIVIHTIPVARLLWNARFPFNKVVKKAMYAIASARYARRLAETTEFDAVLIYNIPHALFPRIGTITVLDIADDYVAMLAHELGGFLGRLFRGMAAHLLATMAARSDLTTCVSQELVRYAPEAFVLPNGASTHMERGVLGSPPQSASWLRDGSPVVGFLGAFEYFVDFRMLLGAARLMPDVQFTLVGSGRLFDQVDQEVRRLSLDNVVLTGPLRHDVAIEVIREVDICLIPFTMDPVSQAACPIKLFEYFSLGKPVISTRLRGVQEVAADVVYYADDAPSLAAAIRAIASQPEEAANRARREQDLISSTYSWERIADRFVSLLGRTLDSHDGIS
jgi:glycosyltransferase involved in cell wall biosynthesis